MSKYRVEEYVDSTTSGYHSLIRSASAQDPAYSQPVSAVVLHEYCAPPDDIDYFLMMFQFTKRVKGLSGYKP